MRKDRIKKRLIDVLARAVLNKRHREGMSKKIVKSFKAFISSNEGDGIYPVEMQTLYYWSGIWLKEIAIMIINGELEMNDFKTVNENKIATPKSGTDNYSFEIMGIK